MNFIPNFLEDENCKITEEAIDGGRKYTVKSEHGDVIEYRATLNLTLYTKCTVSVNGHVWYSETDHETVNRDVASFKEAVLAVYNQMHVNEGNERDEGREQVRLRANTIFGK